MTDHEPEQWIEVGRVIGAYGIKGWLRVASYTADSEAVLAYRPWRFRWKNGAVEVPTLLEARVHGKGLVVHLAECTDRDVAETWAGVVIEVPAVALPPLDTGEYYWGQLVGLVVETTDGVSLGTVSELLATGANDVLVVQGERERLIPYIADVVRGVETEQGRIVVAWDPEF
ncbi:MAG TPA: ribosome maturation factor RimM [Acidiferrobacter sp.]|nr:ribosome maturation factor RimM [Acidiferrobacter sp.]